MVSGGEAAEADLTKRSSVSFTDLQAVMIVS